MWIIAVLAGLMALSFFVLWTPLDMVLHADIDGKPKVRLRLSWLFGLVSREITGEKRKPAERDKTAKGRRKRGWVDSRVIFRVLRTKGLRRHLQELVKDLFACFRFRDIAAYFKVGLGDPADTGLLFTLIGPAAVFLGSSNIHQIRIEPSFSDDATLQGYSHGTFRVRPIRLFPPLLKFAFSLTTLRTAWTLMASKWKRKK